MAGELDEARVESDDLTGALEDGGLEVVIEEPARHAAEGVEGSYVSEEEALHGLVEEELGVHGTCVRQHHHEAHDRPSRASDDEVAEVPPVDLALFSGQRRESQERLGSGSRTKTRDQPPELHDRASIASHAQHLVQARRAQTRMPRERLDDDRVIGVECRWAHETRAHEAIRLDGGAHGVVMEAKLGRDGAELPVFGIEETTNLSAAFGRDHRATSRASNR